MGGMTPARIKIKSFSALKYIVTVKSKTIKIPSFYAKSFNMFILLCDMHFFLKIRLSLNYEILNSVYAIDRLL